MTNYSSIFILACATFEVKTAEITVGPQCRAGATKLFSVQQQTRCVSQRGPLLQLSHPANFWQRDNLNQLTFLTTL